MVDDKIETPEGLCDKCHGVAMAKVRVGKDGLRLEFCGSCYQRRAHALFLDGWVVKSSPNPQEKTLAADREG